MTSKPKDSQNGGQTKDTTTTTIDIRYLVLMILTTMAVFFTIGAHTISIDKSDPSAPMHASNDATKDSGAAPINRKISAEDLNERHVNYKQPSYEDLGTGEGVTKYSSNGTDDIISGVEGGHLPAGQHLLVDIKNVNADFLNSAERLSNAIVETVKVAGLTLLSSHCHSLVPAGVSCVGVLLESHISFHTWPEEGVITLDLFTCGPNPLLPVIPTLEKLFGIPRDDEEIDDGEEDDDDEDEEVETFWSHELRGFRDGEVYRGATKDNYLDSSSDLAEWIINRLSLKSKTQIVATMSEHHRIDVWDVKGNEDLPSYSDAMEQNFTVGDPRWLDSEFSSPHRILFMNGALQISTVHDREYHETLVHPAMFAHPNPTHVAVVGGGDGAVVRELLKHNTVESITVIEIDELLVEIVREHLPSLTDCSDITGVASNCLDDKRVNLVIEDALTWFLDRFGTNPTKESIKFDVIFFDVLAIEDNRELINEAFLTALTNALTEEGVFVSELDSAATIHEPKVGAERGTEMQEIFMNTIEANTGAMFLYEEGHIGFSAPIAFLLACKSTSCRDRWYANQMNIEYQIGERTETTNSGEPIFLHYDGTTHASYQNTPRGWESTYCRREPMPFECDYRNIDLTKNLYEIDNFEVKKSTDAAGVEVFSTYAMVDIPEGSYIMPTHLAASSEITDYTLDNVKAVASIGDASIIKDFLGFIEDNGHRTTSTGRSLTYVEVGGTIDIRKSSNTDEVNIGRWMPMHPSGKQPVYSPVYERHMNSFDVFMVATRDIKKGEEIVRSENTWSV